MSGWNLLLGHNVREKNAALPNMSTCLLYYFTSSPFHIWSSNKKIYWTDLFSIEKSVHFTVLDFIKVDKIKKFPGLSPWTPSTFQRIFAQERTYAPALNTTMSSWKKCSEAWGRPWPTLRYGLIGCFKTGLQCSKLCTMSGITVFANWILLGDQF